MSRGMTKETIEFLHRKPKRKIVQITSMGPGYVLALCNDGTCWIGYGSNVNKKKNEHGIPRMECVWEKYDMDIPQPGDDE